MDSPQLVKSHRGKLLLVHQEYTLTLNKRQNGKCYFRCTHKKPVQCHATAVVKGELEPGNFEVVSHRVERHHHEKFPIDILIKNFNDQFKKACVENLDVSVLKVYEDERIRFTASLSPAQKNAFLQNSFL